jgi:hypothetical protein
MVAERCWVLAELVVVDVKDSGGGSRDRTTRHAILIGRSDQCVEDQARERSLRISNRSTRGQKGVLFRLCCSLSLSLRFFSPSSCETCLKAASNAFLSSGRAVRYTQTSFPRLIFNALVRSQAGLAGARREETQGKRKGATKAKEHVAGRGENGLRARLGTTSADFRMALHLR